ncbi:MAG: imidazolonepropionase [Rhodospirillales bacterium]|nr:imidazolonepropionase [Rhodospirillales bacterium]
MAQKIDRLWRNCRLATLQGEGYGVIEKAALATTGGVISWLGPEDEMPEFNGGETIDLGGRWITPGLIDCHTHLVYAGNRAPEFEQRLNGATYEEISKAGGGIVSTVRATRAASKADLIKQSLPRLDHIMAEGVTTVEIKSGYGLDTPTECKMLEAARALGELRKVRVVTSFLGAHALPAEAEGDKDAYIDRVCREQLPAAAAAGLVDAVDAFCEGIGFSNAQTRRVFEAARALGLPVKLHAEQLSNLNGAALVAEFGGLSADHLEYVDAAGLKAMADAGTVAVLLPGAFYFLRDTHLPPIALMRKHNVAMAVATDCNPGSSPLTSILLAMNMACTLFQMTPVEALAGVTLHAAKALGLADEIGTLEPGKACDLAIWDIAHPAELSYAIGFNPLSARIKGGLNA